jgi:predicted HTH domain antitoxin
MPVSIPDEVLISARLSPQELKRELAIALFQQERLTLGQAAQLAELGQLEFQRLLASRRISIHYGVAELEQDLQTIGPMTTP